MSKLIKWPKNKHTSATDVAGFVERADSNEVSGWAFDRTGTPVELALRIDGSTFAAAATWSARPDVAAKLGANDARVGFVILPAGSVKEQIARAVQECKPVDVVANGVVLPLAKGVVPGLNVMQGSIDSVKHFVISGWAARSNEPLAAFELLCNGRPIDCAFIRKERRDVTVARGIKDLETGYEIELPGRIWEGMTENGVCRLELRGEGAFLTSQPIELDRTMEIEWIADIIKMKNERSRKRLLRLALKHIHYGNLMPRLSLEDAQFVQNFAAQDKFGDEELDSTGRLESSTAIEPPRAYVGRPCNFILAGWAVNADGRPAALEVRINNEIIDCTVIRRRDLNLANELEATDPEIGFEIELPGHIWNRRSGEGGRIQVFADGVLIEGVPLELTRTDAVRWINDIMRMKEGLKKQYFALLALEHIRYGNFFQRLKAQVQKQVKTFSREVQLQDFVFPKTGERTRADSVPEMDGTLHLRQTLRRLGRGNMSYQIQFKKEGSAFADTAKETTLDTVFYRTCYPDLRHMNDKELTSHWENFGSKEQRYPNFTTLLKGKGFDPEAAFDFDPDFYLNYYRDLNEAGLKTELELRLHYVLNGLPEGRIPTLRHWMEANKYDPKLLPAGIELKTIINVNAEYGIEITLKNVLDLISGQSAYPVRISKDDSVNANFYFDIAKHFEASRNFQAVRTLLRACMMFDTRAPFLELLGNNYLAETDYQTAIAHYKSAAGHKGFSKSLYLNLASCEKQLAHPIQAIEALLKGIEITPEFSLLHERLDEYIQDYWLKQQGELAVFSATDDRESLIAKEMELSGFIYHAYLNAYGVSRNPDWTGRCNLNRILIVGDFNLPQCLRYRVNQKVEQLEAAGKEVATISWMDLAQELEKIVFHDVVIFYRVPAEPLVLKAMAQVNAAGKLSFYEIDDLLFDPLYPPPIESYGGYVDINTYIGLTKGMALLHAAARCCRFGIASTRPLADKLRALVFGHECFVHRNALDSLNIFRQQDKSSKTTIDIFYGSGTLAHNEDFHDLVLPAITRILDEYAAVRLVIAGYLKLPSRFTELYGERIKQMPPVNNVQAYWTLLERADINLAVLHDDEFNGCKSELKWFEAACVGIPSVVSSTANYRDVIKNGEDGLMAANAEEWYRSLKALIQNPELRRAIAERARKRVQTEYSIDAMARNISELMDQALTQAQPPSSDKRKKIALVNVFFPPQSIGGGTRVVEDNFDLLQRDHGNRFELCVFTTDVEHTAQHKMTVYNHKGCRVYRATPLWRENMDWHPKDEKMGELFKKFLDAERPDLIHFHCIQRLTASVVEAAKAAGVPYIVTIHDAWWISDHQFLVDDDGTVYAEGHPDPYESRTLPKNVTLSDSIVRTHYLKGLLQGAREVLAVSSTFADIYRKNEIPRIRVNKNGISESVKWQPKNTSYTDKVVCAHIGGMAEHKGYFILKTAIEALQPEHIEMLVVDHSKDEGYQQKTLWGMVPVTFIGRMSQARVAELYERIDVLCAPSTWPESYGLVTREAAACGCWVVASIMGGIGEDVAEGESGFVVKPNVVALTACLDQIDRDPARFKGPAHPPVPRKAGEQVKELTEIYKSVQ